MSNIGNHKSSPWSAYGAQRPVEHLRTIYEDSPVVVPSAHQVAGANVFAREIADNKKRGDLYRLVLADALDSYEPKQLKAFVKSVTDMRLSADEILELATAHKKKASK